MTPDGRTLIFSTYLGGSVWDTPWGIAIDNQRNVYVAGATSSTNFPVVNASQNANAGMSEAWIAKLNPTGNNLIYSTYLGGKSPDNGYELAVRPTTGEAYVTGYTQSTNFPKVSAYQTTLKGCADAFVAKFSATGARTYATYLGGTGCDYGLSIAVDGTGNVFVAGHSTSTNFPTTATALQKISRGKKDAFVTKLNAAGSALVYSTYLGGTNDDVATALALHSSGDAFIAGYTSSSNFPTTPDVVQRNISTAPDAFVTRLASNGQSLDYSTFLGGRKDDFAYAIAVDNAANAYVTGQTFSQNFPTAGALQADISGPASAVFRTGDAGVTWSSADETLGASQVAAFSIDPADPAVIVAGTEMGVVRSTDNGATWLATNIEVPVSVITRVDSSTLLAGEKSNLWKSTDGGTSWSLTGAVPTAAGAIKVLAVNPQDPLKVYAGTQSRAVHASIDGGVTWTEKTAGMGRRPVNALVIDPDNPQVLYAGSANNGVYTSTDGGTNWAARNAGLPAGAAAGSLAIDPSDPNVLYAVMKGCVYKSVNRAANWTRSGCPGAANVTLAASNPLEVYAGTGSGVYRSIDGGVTWEAANAGIANAFVPALAVNPSNSAVILAGSSVNGDAFVTKLNPGGNAFVYSTYLGGLASDRGYSIAANAGKTYVIGTTYSASFPTTPDAFQRAYRTTQAFISRISDNTAPCTFDIHPRSKVFLAAGGSFDASILAPSGCAWTAVRSAPWISITAGTPGAGVGSIRVSVASNSGAMRTGQVTAGGQSIDIKQAASGCAFTITPLTFNVVKGASTKNVTLKAGTSCPWAVDNPYAWINITSGASGTGNGTIAIAISANTSNKKRVAQLYVGGKTITINQPGT